MRGRLCFFLGFVERGIVVLGTQGADGASDERDTGKDTTTTQTRLARGFLFACTFPATLSLLELGAHAKHGYDDTALCQLQDP